jgi:polar amino acid transport system substrate-binding protein
MFALAVLVALVAWLPAAAQQPPGPSAQPGAGEASDSPRGRTVIRFLTDSDYPPFNFLDDEGQLAGLNIDLARSLCLEASATCDILARPWDQLLPALARGEADGVIAGHAVNARALRLVDFTDRYLHTPGRFAGQRSAAIVDVTPLGLEGRKIGVAQGTAHEAFVRTFYLDSRIEAFPSPELTRDALISGRVDVVFDDSISLALWLNGTASRGCCDAKGQGFFEPRFFGDGVAIAVQKRDPEMRRILNTALRRVRESGRLDELMQRYFPGGIY